MVHLRPNQKSDGTFLYVNKNHGQKPDDFCKNVLKSFSLKDENLCENYGTQNFPNGAVIDGLEVV